jgi:hypothetical protein
MGYNREIIPKSCLLCDVCNAQLSKDDGSFTATEDSEWREGWLYCMDCKAKFNPTMPLIQAIKKGDDLSKTELAKPMVFESW